MSKQQRNENYNLLFEAAKLLIKKKLSKYFDIWLYRACLWEYVHVCVV